MIPAWLRTFFRYAEMSTSSLRALRIAYGMLGVLEAERAAITYELAMRAWAEAYERSIDQHVCRWTSRGGLS